SVRRRFHEQELARFIANEQEFAREQQLAVAETPLFPFPLAVAGVDARENSLVHPVEETLVNNGARELAAHVTILPQGIDRPFLAVSPDLEHGAAVVVARGNEHAVAVQ